MTELKKSDKYTRGPKTNWNEFGGGITDATSFGRVYSELGMGTSHPCKGAGGTKPGYTSEGLITDPVELAAYYAKHAEIANANANCVPDTTIVCNDNWKQCFGPKTNWSRFGGGISDLTSFGRVYSQMGSSTSHPCKGAGGTKPGYTSEGLITDPVELAAYYAKQNEIANANTNCVPDTTIACNDNWKQCFGPKTNWKQFGGRITDAASFIREYSDMGASHPCKGAGGKAGYRSENM